MGQHASLVFPSCRHEGIGTVAPSVVTLTLLGRVRDGRIVVDKPVDLPDGTEVRLSVVDDLDNMER